MEHKLFESLYRVRNMRERNGKVIFLDIDGVMNSAALKRAKQGDVFDDQPCDPHVSALNKIIELTGADIVLSSTWRTEMHTMGWNRYFSAIGIKGWVRGKTPKLGTLRGTEVACWLLEQQSRYQHYHNKDDFVSEWVVLDDDGDGEHQSVLDRWYIIDTHKGLQEKDIQPIIDILNRPAGALQVLEAV
jgi:hypothetical protein